MFIILFSSFINIMESYSLWQLAIITVWCKYFLCGMVFEITIFISYLKFNQVTRITSLWKLFMCLLLVILILAYYSHMQTLLRKNFVHKYLYIFFQNLEIFFRWHSQRYNIEPNNINMLFGSCQTLDSCQKSHTHFYCLKQCTVPFSTFQNWILSFFKS